MTKSIRLRPFHVWLHVGWWGVWSQGDRYDDQKPRHVTNGYTLRVGFTWSKLSTYRERPIKPFPAEYLIFGESE